MYNLTRNRCLQAGRVLLSSRLVTIFALLFITFSAQNAQAGGKKLTLQQLQTGRSGAALVHVRNALYLIGGVTDSGTSGEILKFDIAKGQWSLVTDRAIPRQHHAAVAVGDDIFIIGGRDKDGAIGDVEILNTQTGLLSDAKPLPTPRYFVSATLYKGEIFVAGGTRGWKRVGNVEVYSPKNDQWFIAPSLKTPRDAKLMVLDGNLFALGGYAGKGKGVSEDIEMYTPRAWRTVGKMPQALSAYAATKVGDTAFFFGDHKAPSVKSGLRLKRNQDTRFLETSARGTFTPRKGASATTVNGRIFVVGGITADGQKSTAVESLLAR